MKPMKNSNLYIALGLCSLILGSSANSLAQGSAPGYEIRVSLNAYQNQYLYLAYHYGKTKALADSALVQANGTALFKGAKTLPGGIYIMVSPKKEFLFELLVDKEQRFSVQADTARLHDVKFTGSSDNTAFLNYTGFIQTRGKEIFALQKQLANAPNKKDSLALQQQIGQLNAAIQQYRGDYIDKAPDNFLSALFAALQEPVIPPAAQHPKGIYDTAWAYAYFKDHYWDNISFSDERLVRTPFFEGRLDRYFRNLVAPDADSIKKEIDHMLLYARSSKDMYRYLLTHFVQKYIQPEYMGQDAVFVHLFEKYINEKPDVDWFTEKYRKHMTDRAYSLMANLIGNPAWDLPLVDSNGKMRPLYEVKATYTVICFWDPTCGHCKELVPKLDSMYQAKWKSQGIRIYGVMTEGGKDNWTKFIKENKLNDWIHVYQTEEQKKEERDAGKPNYRQLYDVYQTPVLYLLDEQKRIIAKKLTYQQMDDVISMKQQKQASK
ncbi:TlpA family protein disulfide reductase [Flavihumibacter sp. UBA7668]|uniref:TlpA family protein disulfide reductase n=1 Tax=Flavihumibacter sp. UBA7668 TaxID=1946542 RepID=UPI0025BA9F46|nr:TlpA family protein disulfide reductase [Flavihumibacter sp. UBA7668]